MKWTPGVTNYRQCNYTRIYLEQNIGGRGDIRKYIRKLILGLEKMMTWAKSNRIKFRWELIRNGMGKKSENFTSTGTWDDKGLLTEWFCSGVLV